MISALYQLILNELKQKGTPPAPDVSEVIDFADIRGVHQHKLRHWFGRDVSLIKCPVPLDEYGNIDIESLDFDPNEITAIWSKPASRCCYVLTVEGHTGRNFKRNLESLGLHAEPGPKLFKRLKRAFGVLTIGSARDFDYHLITDEKRAPEKVTDGMAFASTKFLKRVARCRVNPGDVFQYSMLVKEGLTKGTVVAMEHLERDIVIPGLHNVKPELRSMGKRLFCIEGLQDPKPARTDFQTIINCGLSFVFEDNVLSRLAALADLADDWNIGADAFFEHFESDNWFGRWWERALQISNSNPNTALPKFETKPRLTSAHELEIDPRVSPTLYKDVIKWQCARVDIHKMKVPVENSCAGYIIPDLSQFNPQTGEFTPNPNTVLRHDQIAFPEEYLAEGPVAVVRQPNGLGEALVCNNHPARVKSLGVQVSPLMADPEMGKIYGMKARDRSWLELAGGADYDDRVIGFSDPEIVTQVYTRLQDISRLDLPHSNMEELIDQAVQDNKAPWTVDGQLEVAHLHEEITLGSAVNFVEALVLVEDWDFYRYAISSKTPAELADAQKQYLEGEEIPKYPDCWMPEDRFERDEFARLPIQSFDGPDSKFMYYEAEEVPTEVGQTMLEMAHAMDEYLEEVFEYRYMDQKAFINSVKGFQTIRKCITREGLKGKKIGDALWAVYLKLTGRDPEYKGEFKSLVESYEILPIENSEVTIKEKKREFGVVVNQLFAGRTDAECLAATAQFALKLLAPSKRWHGPQGKKKPLFGAYGNDSWMFIPRRDENYNLVFRNDRDLEFGLEQYWLVILKTFCNEHDL